MEDVATKDLLEIVTALLGVRHEASDRASVGSDTTERESVTHLSRHRLLTKETTSALEAAVSADHGGLGREDDEVR